MPSSPSDWLRLPGRVALLLGLGAISAAGAKADPVRDASDAARVPQQSARSFGDLLIWSEQGRIFVSEAGRPAEELQIGNSPEVDRLRRLLEQEQATAAAPRVLRDRIILVGGGGAGLHWRTSGRPNSPTQTPAPTTGGATENMSAKTPAPVIGGTTDSTLKK